MAAIVVAATRVGDGAVVLLSMSTVETYSIGPDSTEWPCTRMSLLLCISPLMVVLALMYSVLSAVVPPAHSAAICTIRTV